MASNFHCNFELELADDFMEITETLSAVTNDGAKVSALYLLLFFVSVLFDECPCRTIGKLSHIHIHTLSHSMMNIHVGILTHFHAHFVATEYNRTQLVFHTLEKLKLRTQITNPTALLIQIEEYQCWNISQLSHTLFR
jgi:hypothetical protein